LNCFDRILEDFAKHILDSFCVRN